MPYPRLLTFAIVFVSTLVLSSATHAGDVGPNLTGQWRGDWLSHTNGHHGPLQGQFTRVDSRHYEVVFRGRFAKVIPFRYKATLNVVGQSRCGVVMAGSERLGPIMGEFRYRAYATGNQFTAHYDSKHDSGVFRLSR